MMVSAWWLLAAFIGGGYAGILLIALMRFASDDPHAVSTNAGNVGLGDWPGRDQGHSAL